MVWIGLVSYAWYLWHWPLLAFTRIYNFDNHVLMFDLGMVMLALLLAVLTRFSLELPILRWRRKTKLTLGWRPTFAGVAAAGLTAFVAVTFLGSAGRDIGAAAAGSDETPHTFCDLRQDLSSKCLDDRPRGIMIGDSHARASLRSLTRVAAANGSQLIGATSAGCISLVTAKLFTRNVKIRDDCAKRQKIFRTALADGTVSPKYAILYSRWSLYDGKKYQIGPEGSDKPPKKQKAAFVTEFDNTVDFLKKSGAERILVIAPPPTFPRHVMRCIARSDHYGTSRDRRCSRRVDSSRKLHARTLDWLKSGIGENPAVRLIDPTELLCDKKQCRPYIGDKVLFSDTNHPTDAGMEAIIAHFKADFDWVLAPARAQTVSTDETTRRKDTARR